jgi:hypothetical protein
MHHLGITINYEKDMASGGKKKTTFSAIKKSKRRNSLAS